MRKIKINNIYLGNALDLLKQLDDNSIDTMITDPPYGLSNHSEKVIRETMLKWLQGEEDYVPKLKGFMNAFWDAFVPPPAFWKETLRVLKPGATALVFAGSRTLDLMSLSLRLAGFEIKDTLFWLHGSGFPKATAIDKMIDKKFRTSAHPEAQKWEGYKTHSLKPAFEPIILAMKPNNGGYVENALKWGVAGLNIDETRIEYNGKVTYTNRTTSYTTFAEKVGGSAGYKIPPKLATPTEKGRFPANIILDEYSAKLLDEQTGNNPSRFFYVAKASRKEREEGLEDTTLVEKSIRENEGNPENWDLSEGKVRARFVTKKRKNFHPTVKPIKLMEYLVKLTKMPNPNQIYLDPFIGSGTTAIAVIKQNRNFIGFELEKEYYEIAKARIDYWKKKVNFEARENTVEQKVKQDSGKQKVVDKPKDKSKITNWI